MINKQAILIVLLSVIIFSCSLSNSPIQTNNESDTKLSIMSDSCAACDSFFIIPMEKNEENEIWAKFVSSTNWRNIRSAMHTDGYINDFKDKRIIAAFCSIWQDTFYSINIPFSSRDTLKKAEIVVIIKKSNDAKMYIKLESFVDSNINDANITPATVLVTKSMDTPIKSVVDYPDYSVFTYSVNEFYFSFETLPLGDIFYTPDATITDNFLICFANCYDPCFFYCDDPTCLSGCYTNCRTKCLLANWWRYL